MSRCTLPNGVHWDVTPRGNALLHTSNEVWKIEGRKGGYANVYPNAKVRVTGGSRCKKVWP